jgi:hypothetical protein
LRQVQSVLQKLKYKAGVAVVVVVVVVLPAIAIQKSRSSCTSKAIETHTDWI